jgi:hypothetical protein
MIILYARGYRLTEALKIGRTGGLYVATTESGTEVYINEEFIKKSGILQRNVLVQNLKPDTYDIRVTKENFQTWQKTLTVYPETVTEAYPFIMPIHPVINKIERYLARDGTGTTTVPKIGSDEVRENPIYLRVAEIFNSTSTLPLSRQTATSTESQRSQRRLSVENKEGVVVVEWLGELSKAPVYFCQLEFCKAEIVIEIHAPVRDFDFYPSRGDLLIISLFDGVYVVEIDDRSSQNVQRLFAGANVDFRLENDTIYFKSGESFFSFSI